MCKNLGKGGFYPPFCPQSSPEPNQVENKAQAQNNIKADPGRLPAGSLEDAAGGTTMVEQKHS